MNEMNDQDYVDFFHRKDQLQMVKTDLILDIFFSWLFLIKKQVDDHQIESSIRDVRSLGVIPRAKIKTIKMTLVIVIGKFMNKENPIGSSLIKNSDFRL
jgi:hypothetical protein